MTRAPFQVLVLPYHILEDGTIRFALLKREPNTGGYWQPIAGGGEDNETPEQAARRETFEESGIPADSEFMKLDTRSSIPAVDVCGFLWGDDVLVLPHYCFAVRAENEEITLSSEHTDCCWSTYEEARALLKWDDNRTALWELNWRLTHTTT